MSFGLVCGKNGRNGSPSGPPFLMCVPSRGLHRGELRRPEVKIFRNGRLRPDLRSARLSAVP